MSDAPAEAKEKKKVGRPRKHPIPDHKKMRMDAEWRLGQFQHLLFTRLDLTPAQCAQEVYECPTKATANKIAIENMKELKIGVQELLARRGMGPDDNIRKLAEFLNATKLVERGHTTYKYGKRKVVRKSFMRVPDTAIQLAALDRILRINGILQKFTNLRDDNYGADSDANAGEQNTYITLIGSIQQSDARAVGRFVESIRERLGAQGPVQPD